VDFRATELEIGIVEAPRLDGEKVDEGENPASLTGVFRMLGPEEIDERLQSIADSG
jgi:hypothetical protein